MIDNKTIKLLDIDDIDLFEENRTDVKSLINNNDKIGDDIKFTVHINDLPALAIINGLYPGIGIDHQAAAEKALKNFPVYPEFVSRGFIDRPNGIAFIMTHPETGGFIRYLQGMSNRLHFKKQPANTDWKVTAKSIKEKLNIQKVYALQVPDNDHLRRLAKKY